MSVYFDLLKSAVLLVGAVFMFVLITQPDSIRSRQASEEEIRRERTKLLIDLLKENDPRVVLLGLKAIRSTYSGQDSDWANAIEQEYTTRSVILDSLRSRRDALLMELQAIEKALIDERSGSGGTGIVGQGPVYEEKLHIRDSVAKELANVERLISAYGGRS